MPTRAFVALPPYPHEGEDHERRPHDP
jgi:hypothetical protein